jgi:hypothetical protein
MIGARIDELQFLVAERQREMVAERNGGHVTPWVFALFQDCRGLCLRDDLDSRGKQGRSADMICVLVAIDQVPNRFVGDLADGGASTAMTPSLVTKNMVL